MPPPAGRSELLPTPQPRQATRHLVATQNVQFLPRFRCEGGRPHKPLTRHRRHRARTHRSQIRLHFSTSEKPLRRLPKKSSRIHHGSRKQVDFAFIIQIDFNFIQDLKLDSGATNSCLAPAKHPPWDPSNPARRSLPHRAQSAPHIRNLGSLWSKDGNSERCLTFGSKDLFLRNSVCYSWMQSVSAMHPWWGFRHVQTTLVHP